MGWLADALRGNPALAWFQGLAVGFALGQVRLGLGYRVGYVPAPGGTPLALADP